MNLYYISKDRIKNRNKIGNDIQTFAIIIKSSRRLP